MSEISHLQSTIVCYKNTFKPVKGFFWFSHCCFGTPHRSHPEPMIHCLRYDQFHQRTTKFLGNREKKKLYFGKLNLNF